MSEIEHAATGGSFVGLGLLGAVRCVSGTPSAYRMAVYPDGRHVLQGGYIWTEGFRQGVTWKDLPLVMVDATGDSIMGVEA